MRKRIIRIGVFESNSSMTHSLVILSKEDVKKWEEDGLYLYTGDPGWEYKYAKGKTPVKDTLYSKEECLEFLKGNGYEFDEENDELDDYLADGNFETYERWYEDEWMEVMEDRTFTTPSGDEMVAMAKCGRDG